MWPRTEPFNTTIVNSNSAKYVLSPAATNQNQGLKKIDDRSVRRNYTGCLYATTHRPSAFMNHLDHGIRSDPLPKASARPRLHPRDEQSEAAKSLRTSLARRNELVAKGESILCSKYNLIAATAKFVESGKAGGYNGRQRHQ